MKKTVLSALYLSFAIVLPFLSFNIKEIADTFLFMHIPIMLCGLMCGEKFGFAVGMLAPIIRSLFFSMPVFYPNAIYMSLELAAYGFVLGFVYRKTKGKIYISLISSQILGRIVWGVSKAVLLGFSHTSFPFKAFLIGGFLDALPGIVLQLVLIPVIDKLIKKIIRTKNQEAESNAF